MQSYPKVYKEEYVRICDGDKSLLEDNKDIYLVL